jgi:hypothetical protein
MQFGTNTRCSARLPALSHMTHNATPPPPKKKGGRFNYPHYCAAAAPHLAIWPAPRNIVSTAINPPVSHPRYATRLLHHNASLCTRSLVSTTPFFREVTPCDCVIGSRRLQRTQRLHL